MGDEATRQYDAEGSAEEDEPEGGAPEPVASEPGPGTELEVLPPHAGLIVRGETPQQMLETVGEIGKALKDLIETQNLAASMGTHPGARKHVEVGGWQALGMLLGTLGGTPLHAETVWTRPMVLPNGELLIHEYTAEVKHYYSKRAGGGLKDVTTYEVRGMSWEACVQTLTAGGVVVGRAEAMCARTEEKWNRRDDFALRSMAETRAESRSHRRAVGWIVHVAGYSPTPAEEMGHEPGAPMGLPSWAEPLAPGDGRAQLERALTYLLGAEAARKLMTQLSEDEKTGGLTRGLARALGLVAAAYKAAVEANGGVPPAPELPAAAAPAPDPAPAGDAGDADGQQQTPEIPLDEPPPRLEPTKPPGSVPTPRLSGDTDRDVATLRERGCVCADPLRPADWRPDCPIKKHAESGDDIPF